MNSVALLNQIFYFLPPILDTSLVNLVPNCLECCNSVIQFEGLDVLAHGGNISKKYGDKYDCLPPIVEHTTGELPIALLLGSLHLDRRCDTVIYIEAHL